MISNIFQNKELPIYTKGKTQENGFIRRPLFSLIHVVQRVKMVKVIIWHWNKFTEHNLVKKILKFVKL